MLIYSGVVAVQRAQFSFHSIGCQKIASREKKVKKKKLVHNIIDNQGNERGKREAKREKWK